MRKTIVQFMACMLLAMSTLGLVSNFPELTASAASLAIPGDKVGGINELYSDLPQPDREKDTLTNLKIAAGLDGGSLGLLGIAKYIIAAVAILMIVISGLRIVINQGDEEVITNQKKSLIVGVIGLVMVSMATEVGTILSVEKGGPFKDPTKMLGSIVKFDKQVKIAITFIKYMVGSVAVLMIIRSGVTMVTQGSDEEGMTKEKTRIGWGVLGLVLITLADTIINKVFYKIDTTVYDIEGAKPGLDPYAGVAEIVGITNFVVAFISPVAIMIFIIGGVMYLTAGDQEEKVTTARRMMIASAIALVVIYGAFALVTTFISGQIGT